MRAGQQLAPWLGAGPKHIADAVDRRGKLRGGQLFRQPCQRLHMRFGEGRLVNAGLVGPETSERVQIGEDAGAVSAKVVVGHGGSDENTSMVEQKSPRSGKAFFCARRRRVVSDARRKATS